MDHIDIKKNKSKKNETKIEELLNENKQDLQIMDVSIFDDTLKEIDKIINNLEQKIHIVKSGTEKLDVLPEIKSVISKIHEAKNELVKEENSLIKNNNLINRIEDLENNINNSNGSIALSNELEEETTNETVEHKIDQNLLSIDELHHFRETDEKKKGSFFGFYSYVILILVIFFTLYGTLNISKDLIISKYATTERYIQFFYEVVEIIKVSILGFIYFITNII
jgi:hypothetical protein